MRRLLKEALDLYRWHGTAYGLARMIEVCAGVIVEISEVTSQPFVFHIRLKLPPDQSIDKDFIEDLIRKHKPAHAAYVLEVET